MRNLFCYRRVIVENNIKWPNGLAIDRIEGRLYWNDAKVLTIESSDFNGEDRRTVLNQVPYPYGIVIVEQHIYWTDWKTKALHRADKSNGKDQLIIRENLEGLMDIRAVQVNKKHTTHYAIKKFSEHFLSLPLLLLDRRIYDICPRTDFTKPFARRFFYYMGRLLYNGLDYASTEATIMSLQ